MPSVINRKSSLMKYDTISANENKKNVWNDFRERSNQQMTVKTKAKRLLKRDKQGKLNKE